MLTKNLAVPFFPQNDNLPWWDGALGNTQCNLTSHSMLLAYLIPDLVSRSAENGYDQPESYVRSKIDKFTRSRGDHDGYTRALKGAFGLPSQWLYRGSIADIKNQINRGYPVVVGVDYRIAGHIVIVTGYSDTHCCLHDPYGIRRGSSNFYDQVNPGGKSRHGESELYLWQTFDAVWHSGDGWYRRIDDLPCPARIVPAGSSRSSSGES